MAKTVSLLELRTQIYARGEISANYVPAATLNTWINGSYAELYDLLVRVNKDWYVTSTSVSIVAGTDSYALPSDFYDVVGVEVLDGNNVYSLRRFKFSERNRYQNAGVSNWLLSYRIVDSYLYLRPKPSASGTLTLWYIPAYTTLSADGDLLNGVSGWEEYIVLDCLVKFAALEESDPSVFLSQKKAMEKRIRAMANDRDYNEPDRVRDIYRESVDESWLRPLR